MTLQDYVNWLMLYKDEQKNLSKDPRSSLIGKRSITLRPSIEVDFKTNLFITFHMP